MDSLPVGAWEALLASAGVVVGSVATYFSTRHNTARQERADVISGYESLCENLREMIRVNNEEIARLRANIEALQRQVDVERETWAREREALVERIAELEAINARLERQLNQLRAETRGRE